MQGQGMVEGVTDLDDAGGGNDGGHHMVDTLEGLEGAVEESENRLVLGDIHGMEDGTRGDTGFIQSRPGFAAFLGQGLAVGGVKITDADKGTTLAAKLGEIGPSTIGAT